MNASEIIWILHLLTLSLKTGIVNCQNLWTVPYGINDIKFLLNKHTPDGHTMAHIPIWHHTDITIVGIHGKFSKIN